MDFGELVTEDMRLVILATLESDGDYSHNEHVLRQALAYLGHRVSRDRLRTELGWLEEQGLVTLTDAGGVLVARLTARGADCATGAARAPGVKRPAPRE